MRAWRSWGAAFIAMWTAACSCASREAVSPELADLCAKALSCKLGAYTTVSECVWNQAQLPPGWSKALLMNSGPFPDVVFSRVATRACLAAASDCDALEKCFAPVSQCLPDGKGGDGCGLVYEGASCIDNGRGYSMCGHQSCDPEAGFICSGDRAVYCDDGNGLLFDCVSYFRDFCTVRNDGTPATQCAPKAGTCQHRPCPNGESACKQVWCDGDDVVQCVSESNPRKVACAAAPLNGTCDEGLCVPEGIGTCDPNNFIDRCEGAQLIYCDGEERAVDCRAIGFSACTGVDVERWDSALNLGDRPKVRVGRCQ